jgi:hypothetical protein
MGSPRLRMNKEARIPLGKGAAWPGLSFRQSLGVQARTFPYPYLKVEVIEKIE